MFRAIFLFSLCLANVSCQMEFKMGFLAPWTGETPDDYSAVTSAGAVSLAMEYIHSEPTLKDNIKLR